MLEGLIARCKLSRALVRYNPEAAHKLFTYALVDFYKILLNSHGSDIFLNEVNKCISEYRSGNLSYEEFMNKVLELMREVKIKLFNT